MKVGLQCAACLEAPGYLWTSACSYADAFWKAEAEALAEGAHAFVRPDARKHEAKHASHSLHAPRESNLSGM